MASDISPTYRPALRVSGALEHDAVLQVSTGAEPRAWLVLQINPPQGLPYLARIDIGTSVSMQERTRADLPHLRAGVVVSVAGDSLALAADHGHAALRVIEPRDLVAFCRPGPAPIPSTH